MEPILTDAEAEDLLRRFTENTPRKTRAGRCLIMFRGHDGPFFMNEDGHKTADWQNAVTYGSAEDAHAFLVRVLACIPPGRLRSSEGCYRKAGNTFDNIFLLYRKTARIYEIQRESPQRWNVNDRDIKVLDDGTLVFPKRKRISPRAIPVVNTSTSNDTYGSWRTQQ